MTTSDAVDTPADRYLAADLADVRPKAVSNVRQSR